MGPTSDHPIPTTRQQPVPSRKTTSRKPDPVEVTEVEERSLGSYNRIFGVIDGGLITGEEEA